MPEGFLDIISATKKLPLSFSMQQALFIPKYLPKEKERWSTTAGGEECAPTGLLVLCPRNAPGGSERKSSTGHASVRWGPATFPCRKEQE